MLYRKTNYVVFIIVFYLIIFRDFFVNYISIFGYLDELFAALAIPVAFCELQKKQYKIVISKQKRESRIVLLILLFSLLGLIGNLYYQYQPFFAAVLPDWFLNLKFWLSIYVAYILFKNIDFQSCGKKISQHIKIVILLYLILILLDIIFNVFPGDYRYGIKSTQLFYGIHTVFAAICAFLLALLTVVKEHTKGYRIYATILIVLLVSTLRSKAIGAACLFILLYYIIYFFNKKIKISHIFMLVLAGILIGWSQIQYYFFSSISNTAARNVLLRTCIQVANDHFPFGAGFATYASYYSGIVYSTLYEKYGIMNIYGLTRNNPVYVSDSFWPMIIAQTGYIGALFYILALIMLFILIQRTTKKYKNLYLASLFALAYLGISSLAESAFVNSFAIPLAIIIGISLSSAKERSNYEY